MGFSILLFPSFRNEYSECGKYSSLSYLIFRRSVVGLFGFKADRKLGLNALTVSAARNDTHSVFAG